MTRFRFEWFWQVVVGPHLKADYAIELVALAGQHDHRHIVMLADFPLSGHCNYPPRVTWR